MPDPIRVGVVGTTNEKQWWELQAEAAIGAGVVLSEMHSIAGGGLPERWYDLLGSPDLDAVCVCVEPDSQAGLILAALHAGKHVLAVPPVANGLEGARQVASIAEDRGLVLKTALPDRHRPAVAQLRKWVATGTTGDPFVLFCRVGRPVSTTPDEFSNGSLDLLMARAIGVTSWLDRRLAEVISLDSPTRDSAVATLSGRDEAMALVQVTSACEPMAFTVEVTGRDACATAQSGKNGMERASLVERDLAGPFHEVVVQSTRSDTYAVHEWEEFAESIRAQRCRDEAEHTLALARLFLAARRSVRTGGVEAA